MKIAFESGAKQVTGGSVAVKSPDTFKNWLQKYGSDQIILGADAQDEKIAVGGWLETSEEKLIPFVKNYVNHGVSYVICTDISKDGMLNGPSLALYEKMLSQLPQMKLIASGGVAVFKDLPALQAIGCEGAIVGKAIYENRISLKELEQFILNNN